ncbi:MAG: response regulator [candidate division Zixibacteria bacterium]|nr:response regulator [candidate division Zixibacteria bacterium]
MPKKILIIDDEADMRIFLETLFKKAGYETEVAENGDEALQQLENSCPDLITLDILMPKKSGVSFFKTICSMDKLKDLPVIVLSGVTKHSEFFGEMKRNGQTEFIEKPVKPEVILEHTQRMLGE